MQSCFIIYFYDILVSMVHETNDLGKINAFVARDT